MRGEASVTTTGGYGRIVIRTGAEVESQVRMTGGILVIQFRQPVDVPVDRLGAAASEYIGAARRDPDGRALRFALAQKVKLSSMAAGDRLFVDLLPESWTGEPPGPAARGGRGLGPARHTRPNAWRGRSSRWRSSARFPRCGCGSRPSRPSRATSSNCPS